MKRIYQNIEAGYCWEFQCNGVSVYVAFSNRGAVEVKIGFAQKKSVMTEINSLKKNPLVICIPCHRVVAVNGLGGFNSGIDMKRYLLDFEQGEKKE